MIIKGDFTLRWRSRSCGLTLLQAALVAVLIVFMLLPISRADSAKHRPATVPAEWAGVYANQRGPGLPAGLKTTFPYDLLDEEIPKHLQPWALAKQQTTSWSDDPGAFCRLIGIFPPSFAGSIKLLPAPGELTVVVGQIEIGGVRRIRLDQPHPRELTPTWLGDSTGHWEGDTLVVDTVGITDKSWLMTDREPHSDALHVIERLRMVEADGDTYLEIMTTVEDPKTLTSPYSYMRYFKKMTTEMREDICNENLGPWKRQKEANDKAAASAAASQH